MCGIVCRHAFCGLKQISLTKIPRALVLNRWMKIAESGTSSNAINVCDDYLKMEQVSTKLTNIWFDFRQAVNKAGVVMEKLEFVHENVKKLNIDMESIGPVAKFTKGDHIATLIGEQPAGEVTIFPPKNCKNKGNYFKRLISEREKAVTKSRKRIRKCKLCEATTHDSRTCPKKNHGGTESNGG